jgi:inosine/xanthosine triphosphatase
MEEKCSINYPIPEKKIAAACEPVCSTKPNISASGYDVPSGVSDQPMGEDETKQGAINRAKSAWQAHIDVNGCSPDFSVGLEGGLVVYDGEMLCTAYMACFDGDMIGTSRTASFAIPPAMAALVTGGMELGDADDAVFKTVNSKQGEGTVGALTRGVINRISYYEPAIVLAMVPLLWKDDLYIPTEAL